MRSSLFVFGVLAAGLVGAFAGPLLRPAPDAAPSPDPDRRARIEARLTGLERDVALLGEELAAPPVVPVAAASAPAIDDFPIGPAPSAAPVENERIESEVRKVIAERERAARDARAKAAVEKQALKDDQFLSKLQNALDLTEYQREELLGHLKARRAAYAKYKRVLAAKGDGVTEAEKEYYARELKSFVAVQDEEMTKLLGVEKFERLMEITTPKKR